MGSKMFFIDQLVNESFSDILCISEHWLSSSALSDISLYGFNLISDFSRVDSRGGGTAIFAKDFIRCRDIDVSKFSCARDFECSCVLLCDLGTLVICIYRAPNTNVSSFLGRFNNFIQYIYDSYDFARVIVAGDFNIDLLSEISTSRSFIFLIASLGMRIFDIIPTRVSSHSSTCIDYFLVGENASDFSTYRYTHGAVDFSDHDFISLSFDVPFIGARTSSGDRYRIGPHNILAFSICFNSVDWTPFFNGTDPEFLSKTLISCVASVFSKINSIGQNTKNFIKSKKKILYKLRKRSKNNQKSKKNYYRFRKYYSNLLSKTIRTRNAFLINHSKNRMKTIWSIIKKNSGVEIKKKDIFFDSLNAVQLNSFNEYFIDISRGINQTFTGNGEITIKYPYINKSIYFLPTDSDEVFEIIRSLSDSSSTDFYGISNNLLKKIAPLISPKLVHVINSILSTGVFPDGLKISVIRPILKEGDENCFDNYRPISVIPTFSKVIERVLYSRVLRFLNDENFFSPTQFGFLPGRSTNMALFEMFSRLSKDAGKNALLSFDMRKAFDSVDHRILLNKLHSYGIRGLCHDVISSFLVGRRQVMINKCNSSSFVENGLGVPQGSILGPLIFLIFINDITCYIPGIVLYADDIYYVGDKRAIDCITTRVRFWATENKLALNEKKTKILFPNSTENEPIKCLGVLFRSLRNFDDHLGTVVRSLNVTIFQFKRLRDRLESEALMIAYDALFMSRIRYCLIVWCEPHYISRLTLLQKRALRTILGLGRLVTCRPIFKRLKIFTVTSLLVYLCVVFFLDSEYVIKRAPGPYNIRVTSLRFEPAKGWDNRRVTLATRVLNALPLELYDLPRGMLMRRLRSYLINNPFYDLGEFFSKKINFSPNDCQLVNL